MFLFLTDRCRSLEDSHCPVIEEDYGGSWYCFPDIGLQTPVPDGTRSETKYYIFVVVVVVV